MVFGVMEYYFSIQSEEMRAQVLLLLRFSGTTAECTCMIIRWSFGWLHDECVYFVRSVTSACYYRSSSYAQYLYDYCSGILVFVVLLRRMCSLMSASMSTSDLHVVVDLHFSTAIQGISIVGCWFVV